MCRTYLLAKTGEGAGHIAEECPVNIEVQDAVFWIDEKRSSCFPRSGDGDCCAYNFDGNRQGARCVQ